MARLGKARGRMANTSSGEADSNGVASPMLGKARLGQARLGPAGQGKARGRMANTSSGEKILTSFLSDARHGRARRG